MPGYSVLQVPGRPNFQSELVGLLGDPRVVRSYALIAFATLSGVQLLGPEPGGVLYQFLDNGNEVDWIVGVDAVTTADALEALRDLSNIFPTNCTIRVFESQNRTLFHPKFYLFEKDTGEGFLLGGSNNLTGGGLVSNTEYSFREDVTQADFAARKQVFDDIAAIQAAVHPITPNLLQQLRGRRQQEIRSVRASRSTPLMTVVSGGEAESPVLLRAVNRGSGRLSQVQFAVEVMQQFFGLSTGGETVRLQELQANGALGPIEVRPLTFPQRNRNRRLQIRALNGKIYPASGQWPILIFQEIKPADLYRYVLLMPGDPGYAALETHLSALPPRGNQTPWDITTADQVLTLWPGYPV